MNYFRHFSRLPLSCFLRSQNARVKAPFFVFNVVGYITVRFNIMLLCLTVHMMQNVKKVICITKSRLSVRKHLRIEYSPLLDGIE